MLRLLQLCISQNKYRNHLEMSQVGRSQRMRSCAVTTSHIESGNESGQRYSRCADAL